uniref:Uncharacterized protein n=1 Tax=Rhizophora mucronata TaxID=61149 RepID=A0A2P2ILG2_RHIMU
MKGMIWGRGIKSLFLFIVSCTSIGDAHSTSTHIFSSNMQIWHWP